MMSGAALSQRLNSSRRLRDLPLQVRQLGERSVEVVQADTHSLSGLVFGVHQSALETQAQFTLKQQRHTSLPNTGRPGHAAAALEAIATKPLNKLPFWTVVNPSRSIPGQLGRGL